jgi:uncharacterized protein
MSSDPFWKYVNGSRRFIFLEAFIYFSTQWVIFEPNRAPRWARVKQTTTDYLRTEWRNGDVGREKKEAISDAVGRVTMLVGDILNGRLIVEIGIAPVRPAEFVILRIIQQAGATTTPTTRERSRHPRTAETTEEVSDRAAGVRNRHSW